MLELPAVLAASSTQASAALNPLLWYEIRHLAVDVAGAEDTNSIVLAYGDSVTVENDATTGNNKLPLPSGAVTYIRGVATLNYRTAAGAPTFSVSPLDAAG